MRPEPHQTYNLSMYKFFIKRFGVFKAVLIVTFFITLPSYGMTVLANAIFDLHIVSGGYILSIVIPVFLAPPLIFMEINSMQKLEQTRAELHKLATIDVLTGICNRRHFLAQAEEMLAAAPPGQLISLAVIDLDRFKQINDQYGHLVGDEALVAITHAIQDHLPEEAIFGRFGGDEFICICQKNSPSEIYEIAGHILGHVQTLYVGNDESKTQLSITIGITSTQSNHLSLKELIAQADNALLEAKRMGGKQVRLYRPPTS